MTTSTDTGAPATPPAGSGEPDKGSTGATLGDVKDMVLEAVNDAMAPFKKLLGGDGPAAGSGSSSPAPASTGAGGPDLGAMVDQALAKVLGDKDAADKQAAHDAEHAKLREAAAEVKPVDRPRRAKWLGNIYDS